ncbi:probable transcriptional regulatory protein At2g25830 isoform X2 [Selaginella moellendorffii]|uniref:probable transcriptional regulatory protein At2g25830 isoform X2 n=1 Tax=Selaginella moellendorffii TaxID=88036 RepID=UPI000D1C6EE5|nr:probable transcriptional regulatory protein At2g25830 isoform X2 [Selaginella moellendorffii]|eukprot:XP_024534317.1 probable transcriptional regulatory protein At2g25830 isoform X2 [Selaginella moellendorffii]
MDLCSSGDGKASLQDCGQEVLQAAQGLKRNKVNARLGKEIAQAAREGGTNLSSNLTLAALVQKAKELHVSKDLIERNIKKAKDKDQQDFTEITYEAYGFGGVGIVVEVLTDNTNRASSFVRDVIKKSHAKMAASGSVLFNFKRAGVVAVKGNVDSESLLAVAMETGAEDVVEPELEDDESPEEKKYFKVITAMDDFGRVKAGLKDAGFSIDMDNSGLELVPTDLVEVDDEAMEMNRALIDKLLELEDVDAVYSTQKP